MTNDILVGDFFSSFTIFSQTFSANGEGKAVTFRLDNEASLVALVERTAHHRACPASAVITDVVPGYRPQSKGNIEKQVSRYYEEWLLGNLARLRSPD